MKYIEEMIAGPVDVVGDIHGQIDALDDLLRRLNYAPDGEHPDGRRLVFVGDLVDRGPDSVAVVERVMQMVREGRAQCVLGNHELNILRESKKDDNNWFFGEPQRPINGQRIASADERAAIQAFLNGLPVALERDDLRVVHACWHRESIDRLHGEEPAEATLASQYDRFRDRVDARLEAQGLLSELAREQEEVGDRLAYESNDPHAHWPEAKLLPAHARVHEARQLGNPVAVLTSGEERAAAKTYPAGGKWRFVDRAPWWEDYRDEQAVIVGHYWRLWDMNADETPRATAKDLFGDAGPEQWFGPRENVYCVDFSVGGRSRGHSRELCRLAAVRWPEGTVVSDDGTEVETR
jgi:hypothetical protein